MNTLQSIKEAAEKKIAEAASAESLEEIRVGILGKKGELTQILTLFNLISMSSDDSGVVFAFSRSAFKALISAIAGR